MLTQQATKVIPRILGAVIRVMQRGFVSLPQGHLHGIHHLLSTAMAIHRSRTDKSGCWAAKWSGQLQWLLKI